MRFFFDTDDSSHWYMIPEEKRALWDELMSKDIDLAWEQIEDEFSQYRIDGHPNRISFTDPSEL